MSGQTLVVSVLADTKNFSSGFKSATGVAVAAVAAIGVAVGAFVAKSIEAAKESQVVASQTAAVLQSTAGAAGRTADQIDTLSTSLSRMSGIDDEVIQSGANVLLTFTKIQGANFDAATKSALNMSVALKTDLNSASILVGKALNDPIAGISALGRSGVQFSEDQKAVIKSLVEMGDTAAAQAIILKELETQFGGSAEAFGATAEGAEQRFKNAFGNIQEIIGGAFLDTLTTVFGKAADLLYALAENPGFLSFVEGISTLVQDLLNGEGAVGGFASQLLPLLSFLSPFGVVLQVIKPLLPELAAGLADVGRSIGGTLSAVLPQVVGLLKQVAGVMSGALAAILPKLIPLIVKIADVFGTVLAAVLPVVATLLGALVTVIEALMPFLLPVIDAVLAVVEAFLPLIGVLAGLIGPLLEPLITLLTELLVPILALVSPLVEFMAPAIKFVAEVLAFLIGVIVEVISWIIKFSTGNKEVVDIVTNAWQAVLDFFAGIPAAVGGFFKDAGTWLVDAGRNIIQGFINGIQGMIGAVGDAVGGIMDFVAGFFPRSPAKRGPFSGAGWTALRRSGLAIADQFGSGLELGWVGLNSSMGGISPTLSVPDGARANEGGITLIVQGGLDSGATIGRRVVAALEDYQRSGGSLRVVRQG